LIEKDVDSTALKTRRALREAASATTTAGTATSPAAAATSSADSAKPVHRTRRDARQARSAADAPASAGAHSVPSRPAASGDAHAVPGAVHPVSGDAHSEPSRPAASRTAHPTPSSHSAQGSAHSASGGHHSAPSHPTHTAAGHREHAVPPHGQARVPHPAASTYATASSVFAASPAPHRRSRRRVGTVLFSIVAMGAAGLMAVGMTVPASALDATDQSVVDATGSLASSGATGQVSADQAVGDQATGGGDATNYVESVEKKAQDYVSAQGATASLDRDSYGAATLAPLKTNSGSLLLSASQKAADGSFDATADTGYNAAGWGSNPDPIPAGFTMVSNKWFVNDPGGAIQWPFVVGCPISYGFGWRPGEFHEGADFTPGGGAPIQAIADGTVRIASPSYAGYGVTVVIDHVVDGQRVSSLYAHMIQGSITVTAGEHVTVGQVIGKVGATGDAFGANMHFEILQNGTTPVDPVSWLRAHAGP
jgi:murein DD-endopeptidase MepM/ murein hydrolase activator NlpD